jgi:subtilisin family serine protease
MVSGFTAISDGRGTNDCHGHGTHVAGTVGGKTWGMAKEVTLVPVRVLDCNGSGSFSGVIAGIDWMVANAVKPAVANMSLGGSRSALVDEAVARAVAAGITVSVAAGNSGLNACDFSPAAEPTALTVGATTSADARASFSNYGTCLDLFAPGASITSAGISSRNATAVMSGTSMAAPHVAGLAALYLQSNRTASPAEVGDAIRAAASTGKVGTAGFGSPDALIHTDLSSVPPPPEPPISSPEPPPPPSVTVAALSGNSSMIDSKNWRASVTVAVKDASGSLVPGVVVKGKFTAGGSRVGCTTAPNGTCDITTGKLGGRKLQTQFTVVSLTLSGTPYDPSLNTATTLVIAKP